MASAGEQTRPWVYTLNRGLAQLIPLSFGYWLSAPISDIFYLLWRRKREPAMRNHARIPGRPPNDPVVERMAHRTFRHFGRYIVELLSVQGWSLEAMRDRIDIEGGQHFEEAMAHGKGIIFTGAHIGSIEVASTLVLLKGFQISSVAERLNPKIMMDWLTACRAQMGGELLPARGPGPHQRRPHHFRLCGTRTPRAVPRPHQRPNPLGPQPQPGGGRPPDNSARRRRVRAGGAALPGAVVRLPGDVAGWWPGGRWCRTLRG